MVSSVSRVKTSELWEWHSEIGIMNHKYNDTLFSVIDVKTKIRLNQNNNLWHSHLKSNIDFVFVLQCACSVRVSNLIRYIGAPICPTMNKI